MRPTYDHECPNCTYLGTVASRMTEAATPEVYDLYYCPHGGLPDTVIARYGDEGPEYTSGLYQPHPVPPLAEAKARARARGLIA